MKKMLNIALVLVSTTALYAAAPVAPAVAAATAAAPIAPAVPVSPTIAAAPVVVAPAATASVKKVDAKVATKTRKKGGAHAHGNHLTSLLNEDSHVWMPIATEPHEEHHHAHKKHHKGHKHEAHTTTAAAGVTTSSAVATTSVMAPAAVH